MRIRLPKRFSVLPLLVLVAVVAVVLAWIVKPFQAQRRAAADLAERGYSVNKEPSWLSQWTGLALFDRVVAVSPSQAAGPLTVEDVADLDSLPYLHTLAIHGATDDQLALLGRLTDLQRLQLRDVHFTEAGLIRLLENRAELRALSLAPNPPTLPLSDAGLAALAKLPRLRDLEFYLCRNVSDVGLAHLKKMTGIAYLNLTGQSITDAGLAHLSALTGLQSLNVSETRITDAGLAHLRGLNNLDSLFLQKTQVSDAGLLHLKGFVRLYQLTLDRTNVGDAGLAHLPGINSLVILGLSRTRVTDAGLVYLKGLKQLRGLTLNGTAVTDAGLVHLCGLTNLKTLDLRETQVTDQGAKALLRALPGLHIRRFGDVWWTPGP